MRNFCYIFILITFFGCQQSNCPDFDFEHQGLEWNFFPGYAPDYTFYNSQAAEITFNQTAVEYNKGDKQWCDDCFCYSRLKSSYTSQALNIQFHCQVTYETDRQSVTSFYYGVDYLEGGYYVKHGGIQPFPEPHPYAPYFTITKLDSVTLLNRKFLNVYEFDVIESQRTSVKKFWLKEHEGLIGFKNAKEVWVKK